MTTTTNEPGSASGSRRLPGSALGPIVRNNAIVILAVALFVALAISSPTFLTVPNLLNILSQQSPILLMGVAATFVLIAGGLDLSIGAIYSLAAVVSVTAATAFGAAAGVIIALVAGLLIGVVNGVLVAYGRINALIATIAMSFVVDGLSNIVSHSSVLSIDDPGFSAVSLTTLGGIRLPTIIVVVVIVVASVVLNRSPYGRRVFATGGNETAALLAGVRSRAIRASTFAISGVAAAFAGVLSAAQVSSAQAGTGTGLEFTVLTGVVVGGVSILGGQGSVWRAAIGVLFIALVGNGSDQLGLDPLYKSMILGVILILAVGLDAWLRFRRR